MATLIPIRPEDKDGFYIDSATGDIVLLHKGAITQRFTSANAISAAALTASGALTSATAAISGNATVGGTLAVTGNLSGPVASRTRYIDLPIKTWTLGSTPPTATNIGTYFGWSFDADAETWTQNFRVPGDWTGAADLTLKIAWMPESGTAIADTETVIWLSSYRSKADTEVADVGTAATGTATYTQSGAGTDKAIIVTDLTIDYDDSDQPLTAGDLVGFQLSRDFTNDTYGNDATIIHTWLGYPSTTLAVE